MRILNLVHQYLPERVGGTELYTEAISGEMARRGHDAGVFYRSDRAEPGLAARETGAVKVWAASAGPMSPARRFLSTYRNPSLQDSFEQVLDAFHPDIVHVQHMMGLPTSLAASIRSRSIPYVITLWDFWWRCANAQLLTNYSQEICPGPARTFLNCAHCAVARAGHPHLWPALPALAPLMAHRNRSLSPIVDGAARLIAPTDFVRRWHLDHGFPAGKTVTLAPALAYAGALPHRPRSGPLRIVYIGGLSFQKGVLTLIEAFNAVMGDAELSIAGDETADPAYSRRLRDAAGPGVRFLGRLDRDGVWRALADADVVAVPTLWYETYSFIISEAFVAGAPVLASRLGPVADRVRHGVDGLLLPAGDVSAWREAMQSLLDSPGTLTRLRAAVGEPPSLTRHANELQQLYEEVLRR